MENSVRTALKFPLGMIGSVQQKFTSAGLTTPPRSLRELMNQVSPESRTFDAHLAAGDVTVDTSLTLASNGDFFWRVVSSDDGIFFGDDYTVTVALSGVSPDNQAFALTKSGEVDDGKTSGWTQTGHSPWVKAHWDLVQGSSMRTHLTAGTKVGVLDVLEILGLAALGVALYLIGSGTCKWTYNENGERVCRVDF